MDTTKDFMKARAGSAAAEACGACGQDTGVIMIKKRGGNKDYTGPTHVQNPEARCEFCHFIGMWMAHEGHDVEKDGKVCAAKVVKMVDGREELVAFIVATEHEDRNKELVDGTKFELRHGTVIRAEPGEGTQMMLVEILREGV